MADGITSAGPVAAGGTDPFDRRVTPPARADVAR